MSTRSLKFIHPWRPEQEKVLSRLDTYMDDKRVHIVAAPGAGKTVLGLEVFNRLDLKTLVLSPTVLVKDQWLDRLRSFVSDGQMPTWISTSLSEPGYFTSTTYQALYSFDKQFKKKQFRKKNAEDVSETTTDLAQWFKSQNFGLIILDEAHHLKASWWAVLYGLVKEHKDLIVVSLTATPPYDSNSTEWSRYKRLCGPVDEEISIPELVKSRSLCPHQDYIWLVKTDQKNIQSLERYEHKLARFLADLSTHEELNYLLQLHDFLSEGVSDRVSEREVLAHLDMVVALLQLFKHWGKPLPDYLMTMLDIDFDDLQALTVQTWETLLDGFLLGEHFPQAEAVDEFRETLSSLLKGRHYLKFNRVRFDNTQSKLEAFNKTEERISACLDITKIEIENRQSLLRMVILADYIRDEELSLSLDAKSISTGAYPIFHHLVHHLEKEMIEKTALLTGRLCILPLCLLEKLLDLMPTNVNLATKPFSEHKDFIVCGGATSELSSAYTQLLKQGELHIIVGTRALLGEGWDAPFLNALVMATQTKAYVATNQLRGRVMRIDPEDDFKTASVWHIVATAPEQRLNGLIFESLQRRFRTFAGLHAYDLKIESGTDRLALRPEETNRLLGISDETLAKSGATVNMNLNNTNVIEKNNVMMKTRLADDLFNLQARWQNALSKATQQVFQVGLHHKVNENSERYSLDRLTQSLNALIEQKVNRYRYTSWGIMGVGTVSSIALLIAGQWTYAAAIALSLTGAVSSTSIKLRRQKKKVTTRVIGQKLARVVLLSLHAKGVMKTELQTERLEALINVAYVDEGILRFSLNDYSRQENESFLEAINEFLQPLENPRYLLALVENPTVQDLYPVPKIIGNNKKDAEHFLKEWQTVFPQFKKATVLTTKSHLGEKSLLRASVQRLLNKGEKESPLQMIERWE